MIQISHNGLVVEWVNEAKEVTAKAVRANTDSDWFIGIWTNNRFFNIMQVDHTLLSEVQMRKVAVAILEALG